jgi:hypothetical protein
MPDLLEHPDDTKIRLTLAGQWRQGLKVYRSELATMVRHQPGVKAGLDGQLAAWREVQRRWPPPDGARPLESIAELEKIRSRWGRVYNAAEERFAEIGETEELANEIVWVYHNIDNKNADPLQCPSRGAWTMLKKARRERDWFYNQMYKPIIATVEKRKTAQEQEQYRPSKAEKLAVGELAQMIEEAVEASAA